MESPVGILRQYWGYDTFRECQAEIIESVLSGRDTIGLMPTGGGKSITFQIPALMSEGITLVITPLISLMKDQVDNLGARGIRAGCLHSAMNRHEQKLTLDRIYAGRMKILYLSPEKLSRPEFRAEIATWDVSIIVVDEAHCISQWGYDFRPSYMMIAELRKMFPQAPVLALTASATPQVVDDIKQRLDMREPAVFSRSFTRDNISYLVRYSDMKDDVLLRVLNNTTGSAIVYARSRRRTAEIATMLCNEGISAGFYHAGLSPEEKTARQEMWMDGRCRVMVATNAFGMGIDKPDVRVVVHYDIPPSLEEYYQEAGRAGRDGRESFAVVIASSKDKGILRRRLSMEFPGREYILNVYEMMCNFLNVAVGGGYNNVYECDVAKFCRVFSMQPRPVLASLGFLTRAGVMEFNEDMGSRSRVLIVMDKRELYRTELSAAADAVLQAMLRHYTGLYADFVPVDEGDIAILASVPRQDVYEALLELSRRHVLQYIPQRTLPFIYFPTSRELPRYIQIPTEVYEARLEAATRRMESVIDYVFNDATCRVQRMMRYFGETDAPNCGKCDVCRAGRRADGAEKRREFIRQTVGAMLACSEGGIDLNRLSHAFPNESDRDTAVTILRAMVDCGEAKLAGNTFTAPRH